MKGIGILFIFFCVIETAEKAKKYYMLATRGTVCKLSTDHKYTVGFSVHSAISKERGGEGNLLQFRGVCHGMGKYGLDMAHTAAAFFKKKLEEDLQTDSSFMRSRPRSDLVLNYISEVCKQAHTHLLQDYSENREDSYCGVACVHFDFTYSLITRLF